MSQNGQTHFKNLTAFAARFLKCPTILGHYALRAIQYDICEKSKNNHDTIETFLKAVNKDAERFSDKN